MHCPWLFQSVWRGFNLLGSWTWLAVVFTRQHDVPWLWECLHWLQVQSISEHFLSVMEIEEKSRNGLQGPSLHMFHYCHQNWFQSVVQIFNWVEVPSFVSSGFTKQHGVSWLGERERERETGRWLKLSEKPSERFRPFKQRMPLFP